MNTNTSTYSTAQSSPSKLFTNKIITNDNNHTRQQVDEINQVYVVK